MTTTTNVLQAIQTPAEQALFGEPRFTCIDTATNGALDATVTAPAGKIARMFSATLSFSAAPSAVKVFTVEDGSTVIFQSEISVSAPFVYQFDFSKNPLRGSIAGALHAKVAASGAAIQTITWVGDYVVAP